MMMIKKAFTLVELIVVITILAVLATIGFISMQGYIESARDGVRVADIKIITKTLDLYSVRHNNYPNPSEPITSVTYSGGVVFHQGTFGQSMLPQLQTLGAIPVDPLTQTEYSYSLLASKMEYEIGGVIEGSFANNAISQSYADGEIVGTSYVKGNYNGLVAKVLTGSTTYVLALPTIISSDLSSNRLDDIIINNALAYKGTSILPASFSGTAFKVAGNGSPMLIDLLNMVVHSGQIENIDGKTFVENLKDAYTNSSISSRKNIQDILNIDTNNQRSLEGISPLIIKNLGYSDFVVTVVSTPPISVAIIPAGTVVAMNVCPIGWTDSGNIAHGRSNMKIGLSDAKACTSNGGSLENSTVLVMDTCSTGWIEVGISQDTAFYGSLAKECMYNGFDISSGISTLMLSCPTGWTESESVGSFTNYGTNGSVCVKGTN